MKLRNCRPVHELLQILSLLFAIGTTGASAGESHDGVLEQSMRFPAAEPFALGEFLEETPVYESTILYRLGPDSLGLSLVYPENDTLLVIRKGETAELLRRFVNDDKFREMLQIRTKSGSIGYVFSNAFRLLETFGERGAILAIHMRAPYEYECFVEDVSWMRQRYIEFVEMFPESPYTPEARLSVIRLDAYLLQCELPADENDRLLKQIVDGLRLLLEDLEDENHSLDDQKLVPAAVV